MPQLMGESKVWVKAGGRDMVQVDEGLGTQNGLIWEFFPLPQLLLVVSGGNAAQVCVKFNMSGVPQ